MKPLPHRDEVRISGGPAGHATLSSPGLLLMTAVEARSLLTVRAMAPASRIEFTSLGA